MTNLTDSLLIACEALAEGKTVKQAAKLANLSYTYLSKQKQTAEFRRQQAVFCSHKVSDLLPICIKKLKQILALPTDKDIVSSQISAIKAILEYSNLKEMSEPLQKELSIKVEYVEPKQDDDNSNEDREPTRKELMAQLGVDMEEDDG